MTDPQPQSVIPDSAISAGAPWLSGCGNHADVVISSRVRLARNVAGFPFPPRCTPPQKLTLLAACRERLANSAAVPAGTAIAWADVHTLAPVERQLLLERHLISKEHAGIRRETPAAPNAPGHPAAAPGAIAADSANSPRGVAFTLPDEALSVMVNEEDHLRIQVVHAGLELAKCWEVIDRVDDALERSIDYAFHPRFGYLTTCPTNAGSGLRMSVMLHLPALRLCGEIDKVRRAATDMCLAVRGFYGEGSDHAGDLFQISNQTTLGKPESAVLADIQDGIIPRVIEYERTAREHLASKRRRQFEDAVFRALGLLRAARLLTPEEAIGQLSLVRLGVVTGLIKDLQEQAVTQLFLLTQPAHLQRLLGKTMDQQRRREARADLVRERLGGT